MPPHTRIVEQTGIYQRVVNEFPAGTDGLKEWGAAMARPDPKVVFAELECRAAKVIGEITSTAPNGTVRRLADHPDLRVVLDTIEPVVRDAAQLLENLRKAMRFADAAEAELAMLYAYYAGRLDERIAVRQFEPMVRKEKGRREGHRKKFATEKAAAKDEARHLYRQLSEKHPRTKKASLVKRVAKQLGRSERSVWGYLREGSK